jgi:hypothetical protein
MPTICIIFLFFVRGFAAYGLIGDTPLGIIIGLLMLAIFISYLYWLNRYLVVLNVVVLSPGLLRVKIGGSAIETATGVTLLFAMKACSQKPTARQFSWAVVIKRRDFGGI